MSATLPRLRAMAFGFCLVCWLAELVLNFLEVLFLFPNLFVVDSLLSMVVCVSDTSNANPRRSPTQACVPGGAQHRPRPHQAMPHARNHGLGHQSEIHCAGEETTKEKRVYSFVYAQTHAHRRDWHGVYRAQLLPAARSAAGLARTATTWRASSRRCWCVNILSIFFFVYFIYLFTY